jgi:hypothetical protein
MSPRLLYSFQNNQLRQRNGPLSGSHPALARTRSGASTAHASPHDVRPSIARAMRSHPSAKIAQSDVVGARAIDHQSLATASAALVAPRA